jgi:hypothetical protein
MEPHTAPASDAADERVGRPRNVDLAVGAILLRCVLALGAALALFGAKAELRRTAATLHPEWSAATLAQKVDSELRSNLLLTVVYIALVLLIAKYIRDGRNWARLLYAFVAVLVAGDVFRVAGFFSGDNLLFRVLSGFTGLASLVAVVLLFLPPSGGYFRSARASGSPFGALFGGRAAALAAAREAAERTPARTSEPAVKRAAKPVSLAKPTARQVAAAPSTGTKRAAPRAKSRKQASQ